MANFNPGEPNVKCHKCNYEWNTISVFPTVCCPKCKSKTRRIKKTDTTSKGLDKDYKD